MAENICHYCKRQRAITTRSLNNIVEVKYGKSFLTYLLIAFILFNTMEYWLITSKLKEKLQVLTLPVYIFKLSTALSIIK